MSGRGRLGTGGKEPSGEPRPRATVRLVLLVSLLLLAFYGLVASLRLDQTLGLSADARERTPTVEATFLAARTDAVVQQARAALIAGGRTAAARPQAALDAAELALEAGRPALDGVAITGPAGVRAIAGALTEAQAAAAMESARMEGGVWTGLADGAPVYVLGVPGASGTTTVGRLDLSGIEGAANTGLLIAPGEAGGVVAGFGPALRTAPELTLEEALGIEPAEAAAAARSGVGLHGALPTGEAVQLAARPAAEGRLIAIAAAPRGSPTRGRAENLVLLFSPLVIGLTLIVVLLMQARRREQAEVAYAESERRFRLAVEAARCGVWEWDLEADAVFLSEVMGVMLGWGGGGVAQGGEVLARIAPEHRERVRNALQNAAQHGAFDVSFRVPAPAGGRAAWIDARGQAFGEASGGAYSRLIGVALDVTEERQAQARAQAAEARLRDAIDSVSEAFVLFDARGRLLMSNRTFRELFRLQSQAVKPGVLRDTVAKFMSAAVAREIPALDGRTGVREAELQDGRWVQISERRTAEGGWVVTGADVTAIKTQEETRRQNEEALTTMVVQLERSQTELAELARKYETEKVRAESANKSKSEFLANMSHELRTPLNAINGFSEIMVGEMYGPLGDRRYREYVRDIHASGQHLLALINDILDMSKIEAGKLKLRLEPVHLEDVAEDAVRLMRNRAEAAGLTLVADLAHAPEAEADYRAVKQILLNLLSNAVKFTPRGGTVTVTADVAGDRLRVSVTDTGIGIAKADLERLARPFEQVESQQAKTTQGTGLGLALTKSLVELHDGVLELGSEPGRGTTASFTLPLLQVSAARSFAA